MSKGKGASEDKIKLYYFPFRARAEPMRMCLEVAGITFEDVRVTPEEWGKTLKAKSPYGQMPFLEYEGKQYGESKAIASFLARHCGLAGDTPEDAMIVDAVYCLTGTFLENLSKVHFAPDEAKPEIQQKLDTETIPKYLAIYNKMLEEAGTGFFVASKLSQADLTVFDITHTLMKPKDKASLLKDYPHIQTMRGKVQADPRVAAYLKKRPDPDF